MELLLGIGIIAFAAVLLFAATEASRRSSDAAICVGNLRQIMVGITAHTSENNGFLPRYDSSYERDESGNRVKVREHRWVNDLVGAGYTPKKAFICRAAKGKRAVDSAIYWSEVSYGINMALSFDYPNTAHDQRTARMTEVSAETILVTDAALTPNFDDGGRHGSYYAYPWANIGANSGQSYPRHRGGCNVLWGDGRVTTVYATNPRDPATIYDAEALGRVYSFPKHWLRIK